MAYPDSILLIGTRAAQPAATAVAPGTLYSVTDESNLVEQSDGAVWTTYAGAGGGGGAMGISAGTQSVSTGTVVFSNSNGITFGMSGSSRITASHDGLTSQSNQAASAANGSFAFQTLSFSNLNGISFGTSAGSAITASHNALTSQSNQALSGSNGSFTFQTATFGALNGLTHYTSNGSLVGSYSVPVVSNALQSVGSATGSGTNTSRFAADDHVHAGVFSVGVSTAGNTAGDTRVDVGRFVLQGGNNVTLSQITAANALNTIVISGPTVGGAQTGISGIQVSDTTYTSGTVTFQNANGISFGSSGANGVSASYTVPSTAGLLSNIRVSAGTTSNLLSAVTFSNANGVSFGIDASTITASVATSLTNIRVSAGTTSNLLSALTFSNANGITFGLDASTVTASHNGLTSQSNQNVTAGNGGFAFQTLSFSDVNGISFGTSAGSAITASYTVPTQTNQTGGIYAVGNTTGQSSSSTYDARTLSIDGAGIVSVGWSNSTLRVSATQSNQAFSAAGGSSAFQTLGFSDNSNASFTNTNGSVAVASLRGSFYAVSNTTQSTSMTQNLNALSFHGAGVASVGVSNGSVIVSVPAGGGGITNINISAGTTSNNLSAFTLSNSNNVSFGLNGSTVTASAQINVSAGTTSNNLSAVTFSNSNGVSFGLNGSTVTASVWGYQSSYVNLPLFNGQSGMTHFGAAMSHAVAFDAPRPLSFSFLRLPFVMTNSSLTIATLASATATASASIVSTLNAMIYSLGTGASSRSLMSVTSASAGVTWSNRISISNSTQGSYSFGLSHLVEGGGTTLTTQYSISNTNYSFTTGAFSAFSGARYVDIPLAGSLSPGNYWLLFNLSTNSGSGGALSALTNAHIRFTNYYVANQGSVFPAIMGSTNLTSGGLMEAGSVSSAVNGPHAEIPMSLISTWGSNAKIYFQLLRSA